MKTITMLEFRQNSQAIIRDLQRGEEMVLTYRGKSVGKIVPLPGPPDDQRPTAWDKLLELAEHAEPMGSLSNEEIDKTIYGY